ncbi:MAG: N-acetylmuramoyl-L-alanine amidase [Clostridia bacterium]|nr:N-acetylmuramoyl-L-alanine amidase [Clostridia bacterium]
MSIKIYIDQGHNPVNPNAGAEGNGLREQDLVYTIGQRLADLLRANPDYEVRLSRPTRDTQLGTSNASSLAARVNEANRWDADYFISLHTNAASSPSATGSEAYVYSRSSRAFGFAQDILTNLTSVTGLRNRGVQPRPGLYVLRKTQMPATLLELGFITNPEDAALMRDNPGLFAEGIYQGIREYTNV